MKIEIESRKSIKARANKPFPAHTALISITDIDDDFVKLKNQPEYLLKKTTIFTLIFAKGMKSTSITVAEAF